MTDEPRSFSPPQDETTPATPAETALGEGLPANVDLHKLGETDNPQMDWEAGADQSDGEMVYGANHANRPCRTGAVRGRGGRTLERMREIVRGRLYSR